MSSSKLSEVSILITKGTTPTTVGGQFVSEGINFVKSESVGEFKHLDQSLFQFIDEETDKKLKRSRLKNNDLLFSIAGAYLGKLSIVREDDLPANTNQAVGIVRLNYEEVNVNYLYYYFSQKHINLYINKLSSQSSQPNLNLDLLGNLKFEKKPIKTQESIAKVLSDLDAKIELNNRINRELEAMAKTLYDYWFVQFDFPNEQGKPYKASGGNMVYNAELKREIPEGWEVKNIFKCCNVQYGFPFSTDYFNTDGKGIPVIRIRDILENSISNYSFEQNIDAKYLIKKGDILVGMDGNFHINYWAKDGCYLNQRAVKLSETILPNIYLKYQIEPFIKLREKSVSRTTVGHLSDKDLKALSIIIPSKEVLSSISSIYNGLLKRMIQTQNENQQLSELRDWLLPMLMNGQVTVSEL